jgi:hypothetical protein
MNITVQRAIEQSIRQNEIAKITGLRVDTQEWVDVVNDLAAESEDWVETSADGATVREYWGKDEDGDDWRVHVVYAS